MATAVLAGGAGHGGSSRRHCKTGEEACGAGRVREGAEVRGAPIYRRGEAVEGRDTGGGRPSAINGALGVAERRDARISASTRHLGSGTMCRRKASTWRGSGGVGLGVQCGTVAKRRRRGERTWEQCVGGPGNRTSGTGAAGERRACACAPARRGGEWHGGSARRGAGQSRRGRGRGKERGEKKRKEKRKWKRKRKMEK